MAEETEELQIEKKRKLVTVTLARPAQLNPFSVEVLEELKALFTELQDAPAVRGVLFRGTGSKAFSAGLDVTQMIKLPVAEKLAILDLNDEVVRLMLGADQVLVTANNGFAIGMGMITNLVSDFRLAVDDPGIYFQLPEVNIGLFPATGAASLAFWHFPPGIATNLVLGGEKLPLVEATRHGFVHATYPRAEFDQQVRKFTRRVLRKNATILATTKACLHLQRQRLLECFTMEREFARYCFQETPALPEFLAGVKKKWQGRL